MATQKGQLEYLDDLLLYIKERRVVPILGPELTTVTVGATSVPLDRYLAPKLAERLQLPTHDLPPDYTVSQVAAAHENRPDARQYGAVPPRLFGLLHEETLASPPALLKLARIPYFQLFVTTTTDHLLDQAVNEVRYGGAQKARSIAYAPSRAREDLEATWRETATPIVFHLFGKVSSARDSVITEEHKLEWLHALQVDARRLEHLFDALRGNHLLFIGCRFPDWAARFVLRMTRCIPLSTRDRDETEIVADDSAYHDQSLTLFLNQFSAKTQVFQGNASDFVDLLFSRWQERYPNEVSGRPLALPVANDDGPKPGFAFISYASEDRAFAERLSDDLKDDVDVWLDRQQLAAGDDWEAKIRRNIHRCDLFVPLISRHSAGRNEGFFVYEWNAALVRAKSVKQEWRPFIVPVIVDDFEQRGDGIPEEFWAAHVERLPGGVATDVFRSRIVQLVRQVREQRQGRLAS